MSYWTSVRYLFRWAICWRWVRDGCPALSESPRTPTDGGPGYGLPAFHAGSPHRAPPDGGRLLSVIDGPGSCPIAENKGTI